MKFDRESLKKVLVDNGYTPMQFDQQWYEFALLLIIAEDTTPKNNLTFEDLEGSLSDSSGD